MHFNSTTAQLPGADPVALYTPDTVSRALEGATGSSTVILSPPAG
jgi:hypothetical protein